MLLHRRAPLFALAAVSAVVAACSDVSAPTSQLAAGAASRQGGTGGGGTVTTTTYNPLPTTAPAPDIIMRESFGPGDSLLRPTGGKGTIGGFWLEYPGNKNNVWLTPDVGQTWKFCGGDNPLELASPLQNQFGGCAASEWFDPPTSYPTALMPITMALPSTGYELSMEGYPAPIAGAYVAIGFTNSGALTSNLTSGGSIWLRVVDTTRFGFPLHYELRTGSIATGKVLASGDAGFSGWNPMAIRYSPANGTVTLTYAGEVIGTYPFTMGTPKYAAFEGVGIMDDFVLRR
jgi:hypothetical protein